MNEVQEKKKSGQRLRSHLRKKDLRRISPTRRTAPNPKLDNVSESGRGREARFISTSVRVIPIVPAPWIVIERL